MRGFTLLRSIVVAFAAVASGAIAFGPVRCADAATPLSTVRVANGLFRPVYVTHAPNDTSRIFILEQHTGRIMIRKNGALLATPFMTQPSLSTGNEQGLLGMAFHPDYANNGYFYLNYTRANWATVIKRYTVSGNPDLADTSTGFTIMVQSQPQSNHNGGWIGFGRDGYLYIAFGDGGGADDDDTGHDPAVGNGQSDGTRLGKILRIDVDGGSPYAVPASNPFVGQGSPKDEFWAKGVRNPWRDSFDRETGDFYIADVGQDDWEELNFQAASAPDSAGRNYGWRKFEGYPIFNCPNPCDSSGITRPFHQYAHNSSPFGCSVTGGYVYRGSAIPDLRGSYFFADYCTNTIWSMRIVNGVVTEGPINRTADLAPGGGLSIVDITSFGEDANGEMYICDQNGEVFMIIPETISDVGTLGPAPASLLLGAPKPNPSAGGVLFRVGVPESESAQLRVYDTSGRLVRTLVEGGLSAGTHNKDWDGRDGAGKEVSAGVYFLRLETNTATETQKISIIR